MTLIDIEDLYDQMRVNAEIESPLILELITKFIQAVNRNIDDGFIPTVEAIPIEFIETWCKREFGDWKSRDILRLVNAWNKCKDLSSPFNDD